MSISNPYTCSALGHCQPSPTGEFSSLEDCHANCTSNEELEIIRLLLTVDWLSIPSYQASRVVLTYFGVRLSPAIANRVIRALGRLELREMGEVSVVFQDYLETYLSPFSLFLLEGIEVMRVMGDGETDDLPSFEEWERMMRRVREEFEMYLDEGEGGEEDDEEERLENLAIILIDTIRDDVCESPVEESNDDDELIEEVVELVAEWLDRLREEISWTRV